MTALELIHHVGLTGAVLVVALGVALGLVAEASRRGTFCRQQAGSYEADQQYLLEDTVPDLHGGGKHRRLDEAATEPIDMAGELER